MKYMVTSVLFPVLLMSLPYRKVFKTRLIKSELTQHTRKASTSMLDVVWHDHDRLMRSFFGNNKTNKVDVHFIVEANE